MNRKAIAREIPETQERHHRDKRETPQRQKRDTIETKERHHRDTRDTIETPQRHHRDKRRQSNCRNAYSIFRNTVTMWRQSSDNAETNP